MGSKSSGKEDQDSCPFWKKIYQTVTGYSAYITEDIVEEILELSSDKLLKGILNYPPFSEKAHTEWASQAKYNDCVKQFVLRLGKSLNLDTNITWCTLCNYLMFEFCGKVQDLTTITRYEENTKHIIRCIWQFYSAERMFVKKTLRHILEALDSPSTEFHKEYKKYITPNILETIKKNLLGQFDILIEEIKSESNSEQNYFIESWVYRNLREQIEILILINIVSQHVRFTVADFKSLFNSFMKHTFTRHPIYFESTKILTQEEFFEVKSAEIGCFITILNSNKSAKNILEYLPFDFENQLKESQGDHSVVLLIWFTIKLKGLCDNDIEEGKEICVQIISSLLSEGVLSNVHSVLTSNVFKETVLGKISVKSFYEVLLEIFHHFPNVKQIYQEKGVIPLIKEMLTYENVMEDCIKNGSTVSTIVEFSKLAFPYDSLSFTKFCNSMMNHKKYFTLILKNLQSLHTYLSDEPSYTREGELLQIDRDYYPIPECEQIFFPRGSYVQSVELNETRLCKFMGDYNYFVLLEATFLKCINHCRHFQVLLPDQVEIILESYKIINKVIKSPKIQIIPPEIQSCIKRTEIIWATFENGPLKNSDLISLYFEIQTNLIIYRNQPLRPDFINFLIKLATVNLDFLVISPDLFVHKSLLFSFLKEEMETYEHSLLLNYLKLINFTIEENLNYEKVQYPGVAYVLTYVFPLYNSWNYSNSMQHLQISTECLLIFQKILQKQANNGQQDHNLFELVSHNLLHNTCIIKTFFDLLMKYKYDIESLLRGQNMWFGNQAEEMFKNTRIQLCLLLVLLKHTNKANRHSFFHKKIQGFMRQLICFIANPYSSQVSQLSCRLIEVLSRDLSVPTLAALEMDYHQIQTFFLERLRDPMENEELKVIIIDLINTCIPSQPGMTAAFFNLPTSKKWDADLKKDQSGDTIADFMLDYLQNIEKSCQYLRNPLQLGILKIMRNIWKYKKINLLDNVIKLEQFWPLLTYPLFCPFTEDSEGYSMIINIIIDEIILTNSNINTNLKKIVEKFFSNSVVNKNSSTQLELWIEYLDKSFQYIPTSETDLQAIKNDELLQSWTLFVIATKKFLPDVFEEDVKNLLIESCLDCLIYHFTIASHIKVFIIWIGLYLALTTEWEVIPERKAEILEKVVKVMEGFNRYYYIIPKTDRKLYLAVAHKTLVDEEIFFKENPNYLQKLLLSIGPLTLPINEAFMDCLSDANKQNNLDTEITNWVLMCSIGSRVLSMQNLEFSSMFTGNHYLENIFQFVRLLFQNNQVISTLKFVLYNLICYAESPRVFDFINIDIIEHTDNIVLPEDFLIWIKNSDTKVPIHLREWCSSFQLLLKLLQILLKTLQQKMSNTILIFMYSHYELLVTILSLPEFCADINALLLVKEVISFVEALMEYKYIWSCENKVSFYAMIEGIMKCMNASISAILRPNRLLCYNIIDGLKLDMIYKVPPGAIVDVVNLSVEILGAASFCLLKSTRQLVEYFEVYDSYDPMFQLIENTFSVPTFQLPISSTLNFGKLLCLVHFLCRTINQISLDSSAGYSNMLSLEKSPISVAKNVLFCPEKESQTVEEKPQENKTNLQAENALELNKLSKRKWNELSICSSEITLTYNTLPELLEAWNASTQNVLVFVQYEEKVRPFPNDKLSMFFRYGMYEYTGLSAPWVSHLDLNKVENALEKLMSLLGSQAFFCMRQMDKKFLAHYKRELCAELLFVTEFVRKYSHEKNRLGKNVSIPEFGKTKSNDDVSNSTFLLLISAWFDKICQIYSDNNYN